MRYAAHGLLGLEIQALVPVRGALGHTLPVAVVFNIVGLGMFLAAL